MLLYKEIKRSKVAAFLKAGYINPCALICCLT